LRWTGLGWSSAGIEVVHRNEATHQLIATLTQTVQLALFGASQPPQPGPAFLLHLPFVTR
jgi:hypothetical protein